MTTTTTTTQQPQQPKMVPTFAGTRYALFSVVDGNGKTVLVVQRVIVERGLVAESRARAAAQESIRLSFFRVQTITFVGWADHYSVYSGGAEDVTLEGRRG